MYNECKHDKQGRQAAGRFMTYKGEVLPRAFEVAVERGLSLRRPVIQLTLDDVFGTSQAPDGNILVRVQFYGPERPNYPKLEDFYHDLAGKLLEEYTYKQARGKFPNEVVLVDATHELVLELDEEFVKKVGTPRVELKITYTEDVTSELRSALEVDVVEKKTES